MVREEEEKKTAVMKVRDDIEIDAEFDFLMDDYAKKKTLIEQDKEAFRIMEREGEDPRDSFRVTGIQEDEEGKPELRIITSGEKGFEKAKETLSALKEHKHVSVANEICDRYEKDNLPLRERFWNLIIGKWKYDLFCLRESGREDEANELEERIRKRLGE